MTKSIFLYFTLLLLALLQINVERSEDGREKRFNLHILILAKNKCPKLVSYALANSGDWSRKKNRHSPQNQVFTMFFFITSIGTSFCKNI